MHFGLATPNSCLLDSNLSKISKKCSEATSFASFVSTQSTKTEGYSCIELDDSSIVFQGRLYSPIPIETVQSQISEYPEKCETLLHTLMEQADGDYHFFWQKKNWIAAGRDPIGIQPLYYGENKEIVAFATTRKALLLLGVDKPASFPPGHIGFADETGFKFKQVKAISHSENKKNVSINEMSIELYELLKESIRRRIRDTKDVAIAFSGGLDSSIVAFIAKSFDVKVNLFHVSMENEEETEDAIVSADAINLPLQVDLFKDSDVEESLFKVVDLIEEPDSIKAAIGVPFFWTAKKVQEAGLRVLLAGQGADELFGGYQRYVIQYCKDGAENVQKTMFNDVKNIYETNLERDMKITSFFDVELRLPFAMFDLVNFAVNLPLECKIEPNQNTLRKLILRRLAMNLGMPAIITDKPKKAVQYSTGVNNALKRVAKKHKMSVNEYVSKLYQKSTGNI